MEYFNNLNDFFTKELDMLKCDDDLKAYIISIFSKFRNADEDLSNRSLTIEYADAKYNQNFHKFQKIGDYIFFSSTIYPESLNNASQDYYYSIGRLSYYRCYKLIPSWIIYEYIADNFCHLVYETSKILKA